MDIDINNQFFNSLLDFEQRLLVDTIDTDALFIVGKGLCIERLFLSHLLFYNNSKSLILVINTTEEDEHYFFNCIKKIDATKVPKLLKANVSIKDRIAIYDTGGIQFVTSRIITVDLLQNRVPLHILKGILVYRAHETLKGFQESFILRLFREKQKEGFVKAFTDCATEIAAAGIGQLQRLIDRLYVKQVLLLPRFDIGVKECFDLCKPKFIQMSLTLSSEEKKLRNQIINIIETCNRELKQCSQEIIFNKKEKNDFILSELKDDENFETNLRKTTLILSERQERLLSDLQILRTLLYKVENLDPTNAWNFICRIRSNKNILEKNSGWIYTPTASSIFLILESLCFPDKNSNETEIIPPPKWNSFINILEELKKKSINMPVLVLASNEQTCRQLIDLTNAGKKFFCWSLAQNLSDLFRTQCKKKLKKENNLMPNFLSLWNEKYVVYYDDQFLNEDWIFFKNQIDEMQKKVGREAKKRNAQKTVNVNFKNNSKQPKLVNFGIVRYKEKKTKEKLQQNFTNSNILSKVINTRKNNKKYVASSTSDEIVPEGMLPEDPLTNHYMLLSNNDTDNNIKQESDCERLSLEYKNNSILTTINYKEIKQECSDDVSEITDLPLLVFLSLGNRYNLLNCLNNLKPAYIILYNIDIFSTRIIETFTAQHQSIQLELFSLMYSNTIEEEKYLTSLQNEQNAFQSLIKEQGVLMVPTEYNVERENVSQLRYLTLQRDSRLCTKLLRDENERPLIIVDMREFKCELPTVIYKRGIDLSAVTLEVGDYVLAPKICVERKALDDLAQSLTNGRVFKQCEQMLRHYAHSILFIESNEKFREKKFNGPFQGELSRKARETRLLLTMLMRSLSQLCLMWSFSPIQSAELFEEIILDQPNPDVNAAISIRSTDLGEDDNEERIDFQILDNKINDNNEEVDDGEKRYTKINGVLKRQLLNLPYLLSGDIEKLMRNTLNHQKIVENECNEDEHGCAANLLQLMKMKTTNLGNILKNQKNAQKIVEFFSTDFRLIPITLL